MAKQGTQTCTIKQNQKEHNQFEMKLVVTEGKLLALHQALTQYAPNSGVAQDLLYLLTDAMKECDKDGTKLL